MASSLGSPTERSGWSQAEYTWMRTVLLCLQRKEVDGKVQAIILKAFGGRILGVPPTDPADLLAHEIVVDMAKQFYPDIPFPGAQEKK